MRLLRSRVERAAWESILLTLARNKTFVSSIKNIRPAPGSCRRPQHGEFTVERHLRSDGIGLMRGRLAEESEAMVVAEEPRNELQRRRNAERIALTTFENDPLVRQRS